MHLITRTTLTCEGHGVVLVYQIQNAPMHQQKMHQMHQNAPYHYRLCELRNFSKRILDGSAVLGVKHCVVVVV